MTELMSRPRSEGEVESLAANGNVILVIATRSSNQFVQYDLLSRRSSHTYPQKKALQTHINVTHLGKRNFACHHKDCSRSFGYKHLLQRHVVKAHPSERSGADTSEGVTTEGEDQEDQEDEFDIDVLTGNAYAKQAEVSVRSAKALRCPHPDLHGFWSEAQQASASTSKPQLPCDYVFTRGYDLRRHLAAAHEVAVAKDAVDTWVKRQKRKQAVVDS